MDGKLTVLRIKEVTVDVEGTKSSEPQDYRLSQNYPNPFNPSTAIPFSLPKAERVTLKVFDMTGREVATLIDSEMTAGNHTAKFAPRDLAGGLYFYKLTAGKFSQTRKAVLLK